MTKPGTEDLATKELTLAVEHDFVEACQEFRDAFPATDIRKSWARFFFFAGARAGSQAMIKLGDNYEER